jgi:Tfp pilus assembly protein PilW
MNADYTGSEMFVAFVLGMIVFAAVESIVFTAYELIRRLVTRQKEKAQ